MSEHLLDGVPHDDGRSSDPLFARQVHAAEPTARVADMNSGSGVRVPAGVSGVAGRGTAGTDAPTTPIEPGEFALWLFSRVLWLFAAGYVVISIAIAWLAILLAPWGLLLLILAVGVLAAAAVAGLVALGVARLEEDPA